MHKQAREAFNRSFTENKYKDFVASFEEAFPGQLDFRVAETPVFVPKDLRDKISEASDKIIDTLMSPDFKAKTERAVPVGQNVPGENAHTSFIAIDYAICKDESGNLVPQLIELQGFPSVYGYQAFLSESFKKYFDVADNFEHILNGSDYDGYVQKLKELILAGEDPEQVILLEIYPEKQKTRIDFAVTEAMLGIKAVCYTKLIREGKSLFYHHNGKKIQVKRIYNRLIFDDLLSYPDLQTSYRLEDNIDVSWVGHPNWFFRISKFSMPFLKSPYIPETRFLSEYNSHFPADLENYVLKPLFSFAGSGVKLHLTQDDLTGIPDPENYILQKKVKYEPVIQSPDGLVKCEIRMMYGWNDHAPKPELLISLSRLSRGEMIGVRYNKDFTWVGGSAGFFEK
jgi:uncharacterized short protein YbdD (DUF466 family)